MKIKLNYDKEADALSINLESQEHDSPEGVIEVSEGLNIDISENGKIIGIEVLDASRKIALETIFSYNLDISNLLEIIENKLAA